MEIRNNIIIITRILYIHINSAGDRKGNLRDGEAIKNFEHGGRHLYRGSVENILKNLPPIIRPNGYHA